MQPNDLDTVDALLLQWTQANRLDDVVGEVMLRDLHQRVSMPKTVEPLSVQWWHRLFANSTGVTTTPSLMLWSQLRIQRIASLPTAS